MSSSNVFHIQQQIKQNAEEMNEYLTDLKHWVKQKSSSKPTVPTTRSTSLPPVRNSSQPSQQQQEQSSQETSKKLIEEISPTPSKNTKKTENESENEEEMIEVKALKLKNEGNTFFRQKQFERAKQLYTSSLHLCQDAIVYCNRSAAHFHLKNFSDSELDSSKAIALDHTYAKAYARRAFARKELGNVVGAIQDFETSIQLDQTSANNGASTNKEAVRELALLKQRLQQQQRELEQKLKRQEEQEEMQRKKLEQKESSGSSSSSSGGGGVTLSNLPKRRMVIEEIDDEEEEETEEEEEEQVEEFVTPNAAKLDSQTATTKASTAATKQQQQKSTSETITTTTKQTTQQEQPKKIEKEQAKPTTVKQQQKTDEKVSSPSTTEKNKTATATASTAVPKIRVKIPTNPPNNSYEFEKAFNELDRQDFYEYLKIIPPVSFGKIFKESLTEKILNSIVEGLTRVFTVDEGDDEGRTELAERALQIMGHLTRVGRFDMIVMFLSDEEKRGTEQLFDLLAQKLKHDEKLMVELKRVRSKYT